MNANHSENAAHEILTRVAAVRDVEPTALPPLQETIDVDALTSLFDDPFAGTCSFTYAGCDVIVSGDGSVRVKRHREGVTDGWAGANRQRSSD